MDRRKTNASPFGRLVRHWRKKHGISQEALARDAEVSVRHLSFVETGRSAPSREVVMAIACALNIGDVGLFLEAAGYLAPYVDAAGASIRPAMASELRRLVAAQPLPALVHDRFGTIHGYNDSLRSSLCRLTRKPSLHAPSGAHRLLAQLRPFIVNWDQISSLYRRRLFRELVRGGAELGDEMLEALYQSLGPEADDAAAPPLMTALRLRTEDGLSLRFDFVTATLGTPQDIALRDHRLVLFMPADEVTRRWLALPPPHG